MPFLLWFENSHAGKYRPLELLYGTMPITSATHKPYKVIRVNTNWKPVEKMFWCWKKKRQRINWHTVISSLGTNYERNAYIAEIIKYFLDIDENNKKATELVRINEKMTDKE